MAVLTAATTIQGVALTVQVTYDVASTATQTTLSVTKMTLTAGRSGTKVGQILNAILAGAVSYTHSTTVSGTTTNVTLSKTATWTRSKTASTKSMSLVVNCRVSDIEVTYSGTASGSATITIPALPTYTNTYYPNGGSGSNQTQTHQHGDSFTTMSANTFTRTNYVFQNWNTLSGGSGTPYSAATSYTVNSSLSLYAIWSQVYATPQINVVKAYRCDSSGQPDDEGTYAAVDVAFQIWKTTTGSSNSIASLVCDISTRQDTSYAARQIASSAVTSTQGNNQWTKDLVISGNWLTGTCKFVVNANLSVDNAYDVVGTLTDAKNGTSGYSSGVATADALISSAFYTLDILGDRFLYNLTTDTMVDSSKTYYTRSGQGSDIDPYVYTEVKNPSGSPLGYYEPNGMKPGHGVTFFGTANQEGLHVYNVGNNTFGNLTGFPGDESGVITVHSNILDVSDTTSTDVAHRVLTVKDASHRVFVNILARRMSSGNVLCMEAHNNRTSDNAAIYNSLYLRIADDGTRTVTVSEAAPWRNALGASSGVWPVSVGGTGATTAAAARTNLGLGSFATKSSLGLGIEAGDASATNSSAQSAGSRFTVNITVGAKSGKMPIAVAGVWASNNQVFSRGFDLDGISTGGSAVVKTYWQANAAITASQVTFSAQVLYLQTSYT